MNCSSKVIMKSKFHIIVAVACAAILTACGGGSKKSDPVVVPQPAYAVKEVTPGVGTDNSTLAQNGDLVAVSYTGYLYDSSKPDGIGKKLESSVDTNTTAPPFTLGVGAGLVTGWDQAILGMRVGGVRLATLPANLAYGGLTRAEVARDGFTYAALTANAPLVYQLQLVSVTKPGQLPNPPGGTTLAITNDQPGTGAAATAGKTAGLRYSLWLYDGTAAGGKGKFIQTNINQTPAADPFSFVVDAVPLKTIVGFNMGVKDMKVGGKRTLYIPASLAYGSAPPAGIPANANLLYEIELVSVN
jgi:peptidylprolyl isomerase